jgi:cell division inhibitor SepF
MVLMQPRSFAEAPEAVLALRQRQAVVINLCFLEPDQAQRYADYVAGGTFALDGHQRRLDEMVFLFTPHYIQIASYDIAGEEAPNASPHPHPMPDPPLTSLNQPLDSQGPFPLAD